MALRATLRRVGRAALGGRAASGAPGGAPPPGRPPRPLTCDRIADPPSRPKGESGAPRFCDPTSADSRAPIPCCAERDGVARQLEAAREARRAHYEREVRRRAAAEVAERRAPARVPPPPSCVRPAVDDDNCRVKDSSYLDPCAHRPRIFVEMDRPSVPFGEGTTPKSRLEKDETVDAPPSPAREPKIGASPTETGCPRGLCDSRCEGKSPGLARRAGDRAWCAGRPPPPASRSLHTSSLVAEIQPVSRIKRFASSVTACSTGSSDKLKSVLEQRTKLRGAALGRVMLHAVKEPAAPAPAHGGGLDLSVPAGVNRISVRVTLGSLDSISLKPGADPTSSSPGSTAPCNEKTSGSVAGCVLSACSGGRDSWLSLKNIQKKIADCVPPCKSSTPSPPRSTPCNPSASKPPRPPPHNRSNPSNSPAPASTPSPPCPPSSSPTKPRSAPPSPPRTPQPPSAASRPPPSTAAPAHGCTRYSPSTGLLITTTY